MKVPEKENVEPEPAPAEPPKKPDLPTGDLSTLKVSEIKKHLADLGVNIGAAAYEKHELVTLLKRNMPAEAEPTEKVDDAREELRQKLKEMKAVRTRGDPVNAEGLSKLELFRERKAHYAEQGFDAGG